MKLPKDKIIPLKYDFIFTEIFNKEENIEIVEGFIACYLGLDMSKVHNKIQVKSRNLTVENKREANKEIDLLLDLDGEKINIEISTRVNQGIIDRNVVYASKVHSMNLEYGVSDYTGILKTLQINLVSHSINEEELIESYCLRNKKGKELTKKLQIDFIDMSKAKKICYNEKTKEELIRKWCLVLLSENKIELKRNLRENIMSDKAKKRLSQDIEKLSNDEDAIVLYTKLSKAELERNTFIEGARIAKEKARIDGLEEGRAEGIKEGRKEGIREGIKQDKLEIARNMKNKNIDINIISECTGLSIEELNTI